MKYRRPNGPLTRETWMGHFGDWFVPIPETGCWIWMRGLVGDGYGELAMNKKVVRAHRVSYELLKGPIPEGLTLDHLCRNRCCVNPDHLEPVDHRTNSLRGESFCAVNARKTHCPQGHPLVVGNLLKRIGTQENYRGCRICHNDNARRRYYLRRGRPAL